MSASPSRYAGIRRRAAQPACPVDLRSSRVSFKLDTGAPRPINTPTSLREPHAKTSEAVVLDEHDVWPALAQAHGWEEHGWQLHDGALVRELQMRDFEEAMRLLERVASGAVDYRRRPDMCISEFNHLRLSIKNPHHAGLTLAELRLAAKVTALLDGYGAEKAAPR
jgi:pterin-4a-carbinolamine dehydratase